MLHLVIPSLEHLNPYAKALATGWSPNNMRPEAAMEELAKIKADPIAFLASLDSTKELGEPIPMPDGTTVPRLPGFRRWIWDGDPTGESVGEFCGSIGFRWQWGTEELPPYCLGHIGYAVVPWKRRQGAATQGLLQLLPDAKAMGMSYVELTVAHDNTISQRVIEKCGGVFVESFPLPAAYGKGTEWRYRIAV